MSDETTDTSETKEIVEKANHLAEYNRLVAEAIALGMTGYKPLASRFRNSATGEARVAALVSSIKAFKDGQRAAENQPGPEVQPQEEAQVPKSNTVRKTAKTATKKAKGATKTKSKASENARRRVAAADKPVRNGIVGVFGTREGSNREKLLLSLHEGRGRPVKVADIIKDVYGKKDMDLKGALGMVLVGLGVMIKDGKLKYTIEKAGRGDEATIALVPTK